MDATRGRLARIHILKARLGLSDESYRDILSLRYGATSAKHLAPSQAEDLIRHFARLLNEVRADGESTSPHRATPAQIRAIEAMWKTVSRAETATARDRALNAFIERLTGISHRRWLPRGMVKKVIRALVAMGATAPDTYNHQQGGTHEEERHDRDNRHSQPADMGTGR